MLASNRLRWIAVIIAAGWLAGMAVSFRAWLSPDDEGARRAYPLTPLVAVIPAPVWPSDLVLVAGLAGALIISAVWPSDRRYLLLTLALAALLVSIDLIRLQPWVYQYALMLGVLACQSTPRPETDAARDKAPRALSSDQITLGTLRLIVVCVYLFSGLHKISRSFVNVTGPQMLQPLVDGLGPSVPVEALALAMPVVELAVACCLMWSRARSFGVWGATLMHLCILVLLGPWVLNYNQVVWPWNIAMIGLVWVLFGGRQRPPPQTADRSKAAQADLPGRPSPLPLAPLVARGAATVLAAIVPIGGLFHRVDLYLSWGMYAGRPPMAIVVMQGEFKEKLPAPWRRHVIENDWGTILELHRWPFAELGVVYPELWAYRRAAQALVPYANKPNDAILHFFRRPAAWELDGAHFEVSLTSLRD